jgi:hypothetical protein
MTNPMRPPVFPGADPHDLMRRPGVITLLSVLFVYAAWKSSAAAQGPDAYVLASAGMGGVWEDTGERGYERGVVTSLSGDIVFSNGQFIRAPAAVQSRPPGRP